MTDLLTAPEHLKAAGGALAFLVMGAYTAWKAHKADKQTRATGNGFAGRVEDGFDRVCDRLDVMDRRLDRLEAKVDRLEESSVRRFRSA